MTFKDFLLLIMMLPFILTAQDGTLDISFGEDGKVVGDFMETTRFEAVALQKDGKILAAGARGNELMIARFLVDGTPDLDFGNAGFFYDDMDSAAVGYKVLVQEDGKIIVLGTVRVAANKFALLAARLLADGNGYDTNFGTNGKYINQVSGSSFPEDDILDAVFLSDGKIGIAGRSYSGQRDFIMVGRLTENGQNDPEFGNDGIRLIDLNTFARANAIVEGDNGDLVITGTSGSKEIFITRFDGTGEVVTSFGTDGFTFFNESENINNGANDLVALPNGQFLVGGNAFDFDQVDNDIALYRFGADGGLDTNFGNNGIVKVAGNDNESIQSMILQTDGQLLVGGSTGGFDSKFLVGRFSGDGAQDLDFGNSNGWSIYDMGPGNNFDGITEILQLDNGDIIAVGSTLEDDNYEYVLAKYSSTLSDQTNLEDNNFRVSIFPTIITDEVVHLKVETDEPLNLQLKMINNSGQILKVWENPLNLNRGITGKILTVPGGLPTGIYYLIFQTDKEQVVRKLQKR